MGGGEPAKKSLVVGITGASAGLGRAIAHAFAKRGACLGLLARNPEALAAAVQECEALGGKALAVPTDVSNADAVDSAATRVEEAFGRIDIWVNDAMVSVFSPVQSKQSDFGNDLRSDLDGPATVEWTLDAKTQSCATSDSGFNLHTAMLPLSDAASGSAVAVRIIPHGKSGDLKHDAFNIRVR